MYESHLEGRVEVGIVCHGGANEHECVVAAVDGDALALGDVQARLAATELSVVGNVVVDERSGLEMHDCGGARCRAVPVAAYRTAGEHADERPMAFSRVGRVATEGRIQVSLDIGAIGLVAKVRIQISVDLVEVGA